MRNVSTSARPIRRHSASQRSLSRGGAARLLPGRRRLTFENLEDRRLLSINIDLNEMAPGRIIVGFADDVDLADASSIAESQGDRLLDVLPIIHGAVIDVSRPGGTGILPVLETAPGDTPAPVPDQAQVLASALDRWNGSPLVRYAEPDYRVYPDAFPNVYPDDAMLSSLWGLDKIRAPDSWALSVPSPEVVVAVIDSGVDYGHEDLAANMWRNNAEFYGIPGQDDDQNGKTDDIYGWDFRDGDSDPMDSDYGHGTHVAGIIGAVANNGVGIVGVERNVKIMAMRAGSLGGPSWVYGVVASLNYVTMMKTRPVNPVNVVACNISWGTGQHSVALRNAVVSATAAGVMCICSAGNSADDIDVHPHYPASYNMPGQYYVPGIIAVAATTQSDGLAEFSNYGEYTVDLGAPGVEIWSTWPTTPNPPPTPPDPHTWGYARWGGTSMAAPFVTGAVATVKALQPSATLQTVKALILDNVDHAPALEDITVSEGRLNLLKVVCAVKKEALLLEIETQGGSVTIATTGAYLDLMEATKNGQYLGVFPLAGTLSLTVNGSDYGDTISCQGLDLPNTPYSFPITLNGRGGQDTITGSPAPDTIDGGDGGGWISGLAGNDYLYGGAGDDTIYGGEGDDTIDGRGGNDSAWGEAGLDSITVSLAAGSNPVTIDGGADGDSITVSAAGGSQSITVNGAEGQDSINVTLADGSENVVIDGGNDNDYVTVNLGSGSQSVTVNDYDGYDGNDSIAIYCGPGDDIASIGNGGIGNLNVSDGTYHVSGSGFENVTVEAGSGSDQTAYLYGTSGNDTFTAYPLSATMIDEEASYTYEIWDFLVRWAYGYSNTGDTANMYDNPLAYDAFFAAPTLYGEPYSSMWFRVSPIPGDLTDGPHYTNRAYGFPTMNAYASGNTWDDSLFYDSPGQDTYTAWPNHAVITDAAQSYHTEAGGFTWQSAYGSFCPGVREQGDTANLYDGPGDDTWSVSTYQYWNAQSVMSGPGFHTVALNFDTQNAYATSGGNDVATLWDTPGDDLFVATAGETSLTCVSHLATSWHTYGFESVSAWNVHGGYDTAHFYDTPGDDTFTASWYQATVTGMLPGTATPYSYTVEGRWNEVYAYATSGGNDVAHLYDAAGNDTFTATPAQATMAGTWPLTTVPYLLTVEQWDQVYAHASAGGNDVAYLYDSAGNDTFWGHLADAVLSDGTLDLDNGNLITPNTYYYRLTGFGFGDLVNVYGSTGTNGRKLINPIDYAFQFTGTWIDL